MTFLFILVSLAGSRGLAVSYFALLRMSCSFYYFQSVSAGIEHSVSVWIIPQIDHSFNKCLLSAHRVPGAVHSAEDAAVSRWEKISALTESTFWQKEADHKYNIQVNILFVEDKCSREKLSRGSWVIGAVSLRG